MQNNKKFLVITPSANVVDEEGGDELINVAKSKLEQYGYDVIFAPNFSKKYFYVSGSKEVRVNDLEMGFFDNNIDLILTSQGGNNSNDLLELIDYKKIAQNPKPFFGLSDVTVLLNVIASRCGMITYHGLDLLWGVGKNATDLTFRELELIVSGKYEDLFEIDNKKVEGFTVKEGSSQGILIGGCLPSFCLLLGTKFDPICQFNKNFILIMESIGQGKSEIHSMIRQIRQHKLSYLCKGIIIGNFFACSQKPDENDRSIEDITKEVFEGCDIPIVAVKNIGHCVENIILPIGLECKLNVTGDNFTITKA